MNLKRVFLTSVIVFLCLTALVGIGVFLLGKFSETELRILMTTLFLALYSLTSLCCAALYEKHKFILIPLAGFLLSAGALPMTLVAIWQQYSVNADRNTHIAFTFGVLAFSLAHICLLLLLTNANTIFQYIRGSTLLCIGIVAAMLIALIWSLNFDRGEFFYRLLGVFAILDVLGTFIAPLTLRMVAKKK